MADVPFRLFHLRPFIMLLHLLAFALFSATAASAAGIGTTLFVSGDATLQRQNENTLLQRGVVVEPGDLIITGEDGYVQVRMHDNGFLSLRPNSRLAINDYTYVPATPERNRVQLDLQQGVLRSVTGMAGQQNKQGFRLNTPVAAIGIRGTDFTTFTDNSSSKVSVNTGGIALSPFSSTCLREQQGSCAGATELLAESANGRFLSFDLSKREVSLVQDGLAPDDIQPPHPSEELLLEEAEIRANFWRNREYRGQSAAGASSYEDGLERVERYLQSPGLAVEAFARGELAGDEILARDRQLVQNPHISWGRWSHLTDEPNLTRVTPVAFLLGNGYQYAAVNSTFALLEQQTSERPTPGTGRAYFTLNRYEAYLKHGTSLEEAGISNASLIVDFDESRFATRMDIHADSLPGKAHVVGAGDINQGYLSSDQNSPALIDGVLTSQNNEAGLLFDYQISPGVNAVGATHWVKD